MSGKQALIRGDSFSVATRVIGRDSELVECPPGVDRIIDEQDVVRPWDVTGRPRERIRGRGAVPKAEATREVARRLGPLRARLERAHVVPDDRVVVFVETIGEACALVEGVPDLLEPPAHLRASLVRGGRSRVLARITPTLREVESVTCVIRILSEGFFEHRRVFPELVRIGR